MKTNKYNRQSRDKVVKNIKAEFGCKTIYGTKPWASHDAPFNSWPENWNPFSKMKTHNDVAKHLK